MSVSRLHHYEFDGERCQAHSSLVEICHMAHPTKKARKGVMKLVFCTVYRHWRTGKLMRASDYGYKAWPFKVRVPVV